MDNDTQQARAAWHTRSCDGCGREVAARTGDPSVRVLCLTCHPADLPLYPGEPARSPVPGKETQ